MTSKKNLFKTVFIHLTQNLDTRWRSKPFEKTAEQTRLHLGHDPEFRSCR